MLQAADVKHLELCVVIQHGTNGFGALQAGVIADTLSCTVNVAVAELHNLQRSQVWTNSELHAGHTSLPMGLCAMFSTSTPPPPPP